jgi:hypothetical protein
MARLPPVGIDPTSSCNVASLVPFTRGTAYAEGIGKKLDV